VTLVAALVLLAVAFVGGGWTPMSTAGAVAGTVSDTVSGTAGAAATGGGTARGADTSASEGGADAAAGCVTCEQPAPLLLLVLLAVVAVLGSGIRCLVLRAMDAGDRAAAPPRTLLPDAVTLAFARRVAAAPELSLLSVLRI